MNFINSLSQLKAGRPSLSVSPMPKIIPSQWSQRMKIQQQNNKIEQNRTHISDLLFSAPFSECPRKQGWKSMVPRFSATLTVRPPVRWKAAVQRFASRNPGAKQPGLHSSLLLIPGFPGFRQTSESMGGATPCQPSSLVHSWIYKQQTDLVTPISWGSH